MDIKCAHNNTQTPRYMVVLAIPGCW